MRPWADFYPDVLPEVLGCPYPTVDHHLRRAAQRFCDRTRAWTAWLDPITTVADVIEYDIELEAQSELVRLEEGTLQGEPVSLPAPTELPPNWLDHPQCVRRTSIFTLDRKVLHLLPPSAAGLALRVKASLKPGNDAAGVADEIFAQHVALIAKGAKAGLMRILNQPFTDLTMSGTYELEFDGGIESLKVELWRGSSRARPRVRGCYF